MNREFLPILIFLIFGLIFAFGGLIAAFLVRESKKNSRKITTYECGEEPVGNAWIQFNMRYYVFALLFVAFDVETIFLFPWAVVYKKLGTFALIEAFIFIAILLIGLVYAWAKGALKWE